jgi:hypothetical protein
MGQDAGTRLLLPVGRAIFAIVMGSLGTVVLIVILVGAALGS